MGLTFVVTEGGGTLHVEGERLQLRREGRRLAEVRLQELDSVLATCSVGLTPAALRRLMARGVEVIFIDQRGRFLGRLTGPGHANVGLRMAQMERVADRGFALAMARRFVAAKLHNQRWVLLSGRRARDSSELASAASRLRVLSQKALAASGIEELMGIEGAGANAYFGVLGTLIRNPVFSFSGRNRRPPRDPLNAMLSFGYVVLGSLLEGEAAGAGLDPMLGFLHSPEYGRPSLALDLLEELRPVAVDALALTLINRRQLAPADFGPPGVALARDEFEEQRLAGDPWLEEPRDSVPSGEGVYLTRTGRPVFLKAFMARLRQTFLDTASGGRVPLREIARRRTRMVAAAVRDGDPGRYLPFRAVE